MNETLIEQIQSDASALDIKITAQEIRCVKETVCMLLTDSAAIRDVLLFPTMKPLDK